MNTVLAVLLLLSHLSPTRGYYTYYKDCNGVSYNIYNAKCCNDVVTNGVNWFASACCETVGYSYLNAMCCDGVVVEGISWTNGDSCPTETQTGGGSGSGGSGSSGSGSSGSGSSGSGSSGSGSSGSGSSGSGSSGSGSSGSGGDLDFVCYANNTVEVTNPDPSTFTHAMAVQNEGSTSATKCSVSASGATVLITGCPKDIDINLFFSDRASGDDDLFVGQATRSFLIQCNELPDIGVTRDATNQLGVTLEVTTQDSVTPSFSVSSALRSGSQTGSEVFSATVGDELWWTIDIPSDYNGMPSCTAYSGSSNSGSPSQTLVSDGCNSDSDLVGDDFDNVDSGAVPLVKRIWTTLYVFKFYNSEDIYIECSVKLCPSSSSSCDLSCGSKKRAINEETESTGEVTLKTGRALHILPDGGMSVAPTIGGCVTLMAAMATTWMTLL